MRSHLILFVLVHVLANQNFIGDEDEYDDDDERFRVRTTLNAERLNL